MNIYIVNFMILSLLSIFFSVIKRTRAYYFFWMLEAIVLITITAIRDISVGADTRGYCEAFMYLQRIPWKNIFQFGWEPGYVIVNKLLSVFFSNSRALIVGMALMILIPIFYRIKEESLYPYLSLVFFVGMGMWETSAFIMRQWCAIAILTFSYKYVKERKFIPFILLIVLAMTFHRTSVVFVVIYFMYNIKITSKRMLEFIGMSMILGIGGKPILHILNQFARLPEAGNYNGGITMLIVLWLIVLLIYIYFRGNIPDNISLYYDMLLVGAVLQPISFAFSNFSRIVNYFSIAIIFLLPNVLFSILKEKQNYKKAPLIMTLVCLGMFIWYMLIGVGEYKVM